MFFFLFQGLFFRFCFSKVDGELMFAPGFVAPPNLDYVGYHRYVDEALPAESPILYGLHLNAEIGFLTARSEELLRTLLEMQPRDSTAAAATPLASREEKVCIFWSRLSGYSFFSFKETK